MTMYALELEQRMGEQRTAAIRTLREQGWSLSDLSRETGLSRARLCQIAPIEGDRAP